MRGSAGAALLRAVFPGLEELHGSAPLPPPVPALWGLPRLQCCPSRWGNVSVSVPALGTRLSSPVVRAQPLGKRSVVWMWEKSKKCFLLLPLPAWLLSTTPS